MFLFICFCNVLHWCLISVMQAPHRLLFLRCSPQAWTLLPTPSPAPFPPSSPPGFARRFLRPQCRSSPPVKKQVSGFKPRHFTFISETLQCCELTCLLSAGQASTTLMCTTPRLPASLTHPGLFTATGSTPRDPTWLGSPWGRWTSHREVPEL